MEEKSPISSRLRYLLSDESSEDEEVPSQKDLDIPLHKLSLGPRKKLLVLCLGGLLVRRVHINDISTVAGIRPDVVYGKFSVYKRPFCTDFMKFCFERFDVGLWSAAREQNIDGVLRNVTGGNSSKLVFVWSQEECIRSPFKCLDNADKPIFLKELKDLWEKSQYRGKYSASNTLLIEDEPHTCLINPLDNAIFPQPYKKHDSQDTYLGPDGELRKFLNELVDADDVPSFVKDHRIGLPGITPSHTDWNHYAKVVLHYQKISKSKESPSSSK